MQLDPWQPNNSNSNTPDNSGDNKQSTDSAGFKPFKPMFEGKKPEEGELFQEDSAFPPVDPDSDIPF